MEKEISVPAGETSFTPGPIVGELGALGIHAAIEDGKVVIKKDATITEEGETLSKEKADLLANCFAAGIYNRLVDPSSPGAQRSRKPCF